MRIRPEDPSDAAAVRKVNEAAFGSSLEADIVEKSRKGSNLLVSLVAELDGEIVGRTLFSPVTIEAYQGIRITGLGPTAVTPIRQRQGIGTENVVLRQATMADAGAIWRVRYSVGENTLTPGRISNEDLRRELEDTGRGWVIEVDGSVEAFAIGNALSGNIWALFVLPEAQGRGYGSRLHDVMVGWLRERNVPLLWLTTGHTTRACGFYERRGWRRVAILSDGQARYELPGA